jgi:hypothetical protein
MGKPSADGHRLGPPALSPPSWRTHRGVEWCDEERACVTRRRVHEQVHRARPRRRRSPPSVVRRPRSRSDRCDRRSRTAAPSNPVAVEQHQETITVMATADCTATSSTGTTSRTGRSPGSRESRPGQGRHARRAGPRRPRRGRDAAARQRRHDPGLDARQLREGRAVHRDRRDAPDGAGHERHGLRRDGRRQPRVQLRRAVPARVRGAGGLPLLGANVLDATTGAPAFTPYTIETSSSRATSRSGSGSSG